MNHRVIQSVKIFHPTTTACRLLYRARSMSPRCVIGEARVGFFRRTRDRVRGCFRQELKYAGAMQYRLFSAVLRQTVIVFRLVWYVIKRICCDRDNPASTLPSRARKDAASIVWWGDANMMQGRQVTNLISAFLRDDMSICSERFLSSSGPLSTSPPFAWATQTLFRRLQGIVRTCNRRDPVRVLSVLLTVFTDPCFVSKFSR